MLMFGRTNWNASCKLKSQLKTKNLKSQLKVDSSKVNLLNYQCSVKLDVEVAEKSQITEVIKS